MTVHVFEGLARDTPTHRRNIAEMPEAEVIAELDRMRSRRLAMYRAYKDAVEARALYKTEQDKAEMDHQLYMMAKEFATADRAIAKLEKRAVNIAALRLEIEVLSCNGA